MIDSRTVEVMTILDCEESVARHYLSLFENDVDRTVMAVTSLGEDHDWWGHPWHPRWKDIDASGHDSHVDKGKEEMLGDPRDETGKSNEKHEGNYDSLVLWTGQSNQDGQDLPSTAAAPFLVRDGYTFDGHRMIRTGDVDSDEDFYNLYAYLVDDFIAAVCRNEPKDYLRNLIAEADQLRATYNFIREKLSDLVNRRSFKHNVQCGRSPLTYAVAKNLKQQVYNLIELGADVSKVMSAASYTASDGYVPQTALTIAAMNGKRDGMEMVRILLSKGANPAELVSAEVDEQELNRGMRYWIDKARRIGVPAREELSHMAKLPPMDRIHELDYAVVGEEAAVSVVQEAFAGRFGNPQGNRKPLVLLLLGPPGHGKTYFSSNTARSLVGEDNFLFVPCQSIRDDADLFGSRLGGSRSGQYSSDGQLTAFLRGRQGKKCIIFLDEFEKMKGLTSSLGWGQAKKIYQSFLEPWNDGTLSDQSAIAGGYTSSGNKSSTSTGGDKIDCSQSIWILTANWGQNDIIEFGEKHKERVHKKISQKDVAWIQKNLVNKILRPLCIREFASVNEELKALCRRIDAIVPFMPFTTKERCVVADIALIERFSLYREPCILSGPEDKRRSFGNLLLRCSNAFTAHVAECYDPMQGASAMLSTVQQADGKFQMMFLRGQLGLTENQKARVTSTNLPDRGVDEPVFWVHYDKDVEAITILPSRPVDDDEDGDSKDVSKVDQSDVKTIAKDKDQASEVGGQSDRSSELDAADDVF